MKKLILKKKKKKKIKIKVINVQKWRLPLRKSLFSIVIIKGAYFFYFFFYRQGREYTSKTILKKVLIDNKSLFTCNLYVLKKKKKASLMECCF